MVSNSLLFEQIEMHKEGHVFFRRDLTNPMQGQIYRLFSKIGKLLMLSKSSSLEQDEDECLVLKELLQVCNVMPMMEQK